MKKLDELLTAAVEKGISEAIQRSRRAIFTVSAERILDEEEYWSGEYAVEYTSEKAAIEAARSFASEISDEDEVIVVWVYAGEYKTPSGDVYGDPYAIYSISNKGKEETVAAMTEMGFSNSECDEYIGS